VDRVIVEETAYFDHAAATPLQLQVLEAMAPYFIERFGNPSGGHRIAREARRAIEDAREEIAALLGAHPAEIVFTSGGTEADNLAILGVLGARTDDQATVVCSAIEHPAVLETCRYVVDHPAAGSPVLLRTAPVDACGVLDVAALADVLDPTVVVVSVMTANNEVGSIQPIARLCAAVRDLAPDAVVHTDAVQAAGWLDLRKVADQADLVSVSGHKLGGPKGIGVLVVRRGVRLAPMHHGGGQEQQRRSGTHDVAGIVGMAAALRTLDASRAAEWSRIARLRDRLADGLLSAVDGVVESVPREVALPNFCHLRFEGVEREELLVLLDDAGIFVSAGAACASGALEESEVLTAMGVAPQDARGMLRFTLGRASCDADVDLALERVPKVLEALRDT
jgi:cysteine desulfurase